MQEAKKNLPLIFEKIPLIMADLEAIEKDRDAGTDSRFSYKFRGIDDVYNAIHKIFVEHKVFTVPTIMDARHEERESKSKSKLIYRIYKIRYRFYAAEDGSFLDAVVIGEGMDSGDKAGNKAMSAAHKYALLQVFCVPTEDPKDSENDNHEIEGKKNEKKKTESTKTQKPEDIDIAADSDKEEDEVKGIVSFVEAELKNKTIDYKNFKKYLSLVQKEFDPPKYLIGKQYGHPSLSVGRLSDLRNLKNSLDVYIEGYIKHEMKKAAEFDERFEKEAEKSEKERDDS